VAESIRVVVQDPSRTAEARRIARRLAQGIGFDETRAEQVAIVVTEASTNLLKHAGGGEIMLRTTRDDPKSSPDLEVLALDQGPGMANLDQCLRDGFSTGGSPGQGLGAIRRLSTDSDFYSESNRGTAVLARWSGAAQPRAAEAAARLTGANCAPTLRMGAVAVCKPGQEVSGDAWGVQQTEHDSVVLVADGLGHGWEAQTASLEAVRTLHSNPHLPPAALIERAHQALRSSRGAAVAVARIDRLRRTVAFAGVGNISAQIYSGAEAIQHLVSVNGTAGHQSQRVREFSYPWPSGGMLVLHSDGLSTSAGPEAYPGLALRDPSLIAGVLYRDFTRNNDDATVVVIKAA
jgi:anti-sigma regulatory factor (Ser/Thr protein kinase)